MQFGPNESNPVRKPGELSPPDGSGYPYAPPGYPPGYPPRYPPNWGFDDDKPQSWCDENR